MKSHDFWDIFSPNNPGKRRHRWGTDETRLLKSSSLWKEVHYAISYFRQVWDFPLWKIFLKIVCVTSRSYRKKAIKNISNTENIIMCTVQEESSSIFSVPSPNNQLHLGLYCLSPGLLNYPSIINWMPCTPQIHMLKSHPPVWWY